MPLDAKTLQNSLKEAFPDAQIDLKDLAGDDDHWSVEVASEKFVGKSLVQQHKMVYDALGGKVGGQLHALQVKTKKL